MRIALVHDTFTRIGGAERVLMAMHELWPDAPIHFLAADSELLERYLPNAPTRISALGRIWGARRIWPLLALAMPAAVESWDFSEYDIVISSSVMFSKGVVVRPGVRHISYCYSTPRPLWDRHAAYERRGIFSAFTRHLLRMWDSAAAMRADTVVAISQTVADRIATYWHRDAMVIPPPTIMPPEFIEPAGPGEYLLVVARLLPYKMLLPLIDACNKMHEPLIIVGEGPQRSALARRAGSTVQLVGHQSDEQLAALYRGARAVVLANEEDWGLTAVEAMSYGRPVLALRKGGATETVLEGVTGEFFDDPIPAAIADGIKRIRAAAPKYNPLAIVAHAAQFRYEKWAARMQTLVQPTP